MSNDRASSPVAGAPAGGPVGVVSAMGMGWRLMMSDFWRLWVVALVFMAIEMGASTFGIISAIVILPPMTAGLFYVVSRRIDGGPAAVGDLFAGFKHRFGESVVGMLPVTGASVVFALLIGVTLGVLVAAGGGLVAVAEGEDEVVAAVVIVGILVFLAIEFVLIGALLLFAMFFRFVPAAVWDHAGSGWTAAKASVGLVWRHFGSMLGLCLLFWLVGTAAELIGLAVCFVGVFFTAPVVVVWYTATLVYVYRSWTGQPLARSAPEGDVAKTD